MKLKSIQNNYLSLLILIIIISLIIGCTEQKKLTTVNPDESIDNKIVQVVNNATPLVEQTTKAGAVTIDNGSSPSENDSKIADISTKQVTAQTDAALPTPSTHKTSCISQTTDTEHMDVFDSHAHITSKVSASQIILEMDKAGVSMTNLYGDDSNTLGAVSQYPGRFITFVDPSDSPQPSTWLTQGQAFVTSAEARLKTGKYYGIGEANLRYYGSHTVPIPPPDIYVVPDNPLWLQLVDLSAQYHVPISFHFVPDDPVANAAFEKMLSHNKDATLIWAHLGFNNMPLNSTTLNDFLLRYPHLYLDTAGIQGMFDPPGSQDIQKFNWDRLMTNGLLNKDWKQFFETWNSRILVASDAGGGQNGLQRWLNYESNTADDAPPNAIGHWRSLTSNLDANAARNILSSNSRVLFLKEQKPPYTYLVLSDDQCYSISVSSASSVSALTFNQGTKAITFTVADSTATAGSAVITIPTALVKGKFTASVDGKNVQINEKSNSADTIVTLEYAGGIRTVVLSVSPTITTSS
ncbi:hypothetical protein HZB02_02070 [Candidatus Woesearchaeota archaeon]|nr:hypothetical protein [Candidatus Woesearchaeota archaeon]